MRTRSPGPGPCLLARPRVFLSRSPPVGRRDPDFQPRRLRREVQRSSFVQPELDTELAASKAVGALKSNLILQQNSALESELARAVGVLEASEDAKNNCGKQMEHCLKRQSELVKNIEVLSIRTQKLARHCENLTQRNNELYQSLENAANENERLLRELAAREEARVALSKEVQVAKKREADNCNKLSYMSQSLSRENQGLAARVSQLTKALESRRQQNEAIAIQRKRLEETLRVSHQKWEHREQQLIGLVNKRQAEHCNKLNFRSEALTRQNQGLAARINQMAKSLQARRIENESLANDCAEVNEKLRCVEIERKRLEQAMRVFHHKWEQREKELIDLANKRQAEHCNNFNYRSQSMARENEALVAKVNEMTKALQARRIQNETLAKQCVSRDSHAQFLDGERKRVEDAFRLERRKWEEREQELLGALQESERARVISAKREAEVEALRKNLEFQLENIDRKASGLHSQNQGLQSQNGELRQLLLATQDHCGTLTERAERAVKAQHDIAKQMQEAHRESRFAREEAQSAKHQLAKVVEDNRSMLAELSGLKITIGEFKFELEEIAQLNEGLSRQNSRLKGELNQVQADKADLAQALSAQEAETDQLLRKAEQILLEKTALMDTYNGLVARFEDVCEKVRLIENTVETVEDQNQMLRVSNDNLKTELQVISSRPLAPIPVPEKVYVAVPNRTSFEKEQILLRKLRDADLQIEKLNKMLDHKPAPPPPSKAAPPPAISPTVVKVDADHSQCDERLRQLQEENQRMRRQLSSSQPAPPPSKDQEERLKRLLKEKEDQLRKTKDSTGEKDKLNAELRGKIKDYESEIDRLGGQLQQLRDDSEQKLSSSLSARKKLEVELAGGRKQIERLRVFEKRAGQLNNELAKLRKLLESREAQLAKAISERDQLAAQNQKLRAELQSMRPQLEDLRSRVSQLSAQKSNLEKQLKQLKSQNQDLSKKLKESQKKAADFEKQSIKFKALFQKKSIQCEDLAARVEELDQELQLTRTRLEEALEKHSPCADRQKELLEKIRILQARLLKLQQQLKEANKPKKEAPTVDLRPEVERLKGEKKELEDELERLRRQKCKNCAELQRKLDAMAKQLGAMKDEVGRLKGQLERLQEEMERLYEENGGLKRNDGDDKWKPLLAERDRKIKEQAEEIERLRRQMQKFREGMVKSKIKGDDRILNQFEGKIEDMLQEVKKARTTTVL